MRDGRLMHVVLGVVLGAAWSTVSARAEDAPATQPGEVAGDRQALRGDQQQLKTDHQELQQDWAKIREDRQAFEQQMTSLRSQREAALP